MRGHSQALTKDGVLLCLPLMPWASGYSCLGLHDCVLPVGMS